MLLFALMIITLTAAPRYILKISMAKLLIIHKTRLQLQLMQLLHQTRDSYSPADIHEPVITVTSVPTSTQYPGYWHYSGYNRTYISTDTPIPVSTPTPAPITTETAIPANTPTPVPVQTSLPIIQRIDETKLAELIKP